jgi:hydrogenase maturation protein HypF
LGLPGHWRRVASVRPFRLLGGERVTRAPWRSALALCWESGVTWPEGERRGGEPLRRAFERGLNSPWTTSVGRLFDAAAALMGVSLLTSYEAEGPMRLESLCETPCDPVDLPLERDSTGIWRTDWAPLLGRLLDDSMSQAARAGEFHASLAQALCAQALAVRRETGVNHVGLVGGVFQNRVLTESVQMFLHAASFEVFIPRTLPMNDAAISFGQLIEVAARHVQ